MTSKAEATQTLKSAARDAAETVRDTAKTTATETAAELKSDAVHHADQAAAAAQEAAAQFDPQSLQAEAMRVVADKITETTDRFRNKPIDELIDDAAVFARRNPLIVLGGAALLGFAAARFLKSGSNSSASLQSGDPWTGHLRHDASDEELS